MAKPFDVQNMATTARYKINNTHILLSCIADSADYPKYKDVFLYIIQSLKVLE